MLHLKAIREAQGISVEKLAELSRLSKAQIWSYESERRQPPIESLVALADALGVSLDMLIRGEEKEPHPEKRARLEDAAVDAFANLPQDQRDIALAVYSAVTAALQSQQK